MGPAADGLNYILGSSTTLDRSTTHPKFDPTGARTHDLQIMTVQHDAEKSLDIKYERFCLSDRKMYRPKNKK